MKFNNAEEMVQYLHTRAEMLLEVYMLQYGDLGLDEADEELIKIGIDLGIEVMTDFVVEEGLV